MFSVPDPTLGTGFKKDLLAEELADIRTKHPPLDR
jgi:hypothetical protein